MCIIYANVLYIRQYVYINYTHPQGCYITFPVRYRAKERDWYHNDILLGPHVLGSRLESVSSNTLYQWYRAHTLAPVSGYSQTAVCCIGWYRMPGMPKPSKTTWHKCAAGPQIGRCCPMEGIDHHPQAARGQSNINILWSHLFNTRDSEVIMFSPCVFVCLCVCGCVVVYVCHDVCQDDLTMKDWCHTNNILQVHCWGCLVVQVMFHALMTSLMTSQDQKVGQIWKLIYLRQY